MSGPFKMPSLDEMLSKKKKKTKKMKGPVESVPEMFQLGSSPVPSEQAGARSSEAAHSSKRPRPWDDVDEDLEHVVVKIPRDTTILADPSGLDKFAGKLLLEADEERMASVGPSEVLKKIVAFNYQAMEGGLFVQKAFEAAQKRIRELEKSNTSLRKSNSELKESSEEALKQAKRAENTAAESMAEVESLRGEIACQKKENDDLKKEREALVEQMEGIALEAMLKQRCDLMKQFVSGEYKDWTPEEWIAEYECGDDDEEAADPSGTLGAEVPAVETGVEEAVEPVVDLGAREGGVADV